MAKKKKKKGKRGRRKMTALQRKYFGKKSTRKRKSTRKVANKMARRKGRKGSRRRSGGGRRRSSGGGRGLAGKLLPPTDRLLDAAGAGVYGKLEAMAKADANNVLNKIPRPIAQLGYTGGAALVLHLANAFLFKNKYVGHLVNGMTAVAAYQIGRAGSLPTSAETIFTISGDDDVGALDDIDMQQLAGEMGYDDDDDVGGLDADNPGGVGGVDAYAGLEELEG